MDAPRPLVGRENERRTLTDLLESVAAGRGSALVITGEAGIGKTRLAEDLLESAQSRGFTTLAGEADELEHDRPLSPFLQMLERAPVADDPTTAEIHRLVTEGLRHPHSVGDDPDVGFRIADLVISLLEELTADAPTVLVVENLHWADPLTLRVLRWIQRRLVHLPLTLVVTTRTLPSRPEVNEVVDTLIDRGARLLTLEPLAGEDVLSLAAAEAGGQPGSRLSEQLDRAGGNPLFVIEIVRALRAEGYLEVDSEQAEIDRIVTLPNLHLTVLRRASQLTPEALEILKTASVIGIAFSVAALSRVTGRGAVQLMTPVDELIKAGFLEEDGEDLAFRHEVIREALYEDLPTPLRRRMHSEIADVLLESGASRAEVVEHIARAADPRDDQSIELLRETVIDLTRSAPAAAADMADHMLTMLSGDHPAWTEVAADAAAAFVRSGRADDAERIGLEALERNPAPGTRGRLHWRLSQARALLSDLPEAIAHLDRAAAIEGVSEEERLRLKAWATAMRAYIGDTDTAQIDGQEIFERSDASGPADARASAALALALCAYARDDLNDAMTWTERAIGPDELDPGAVVPARLLRTALLIETDRLDDARDLAERTRAVAEEAGLALWLGTSLGLGARCDLLSGRWSDAGASAIAALEAAEDTQVWNEALVAYAIDALIALFSNDLEQTHSILEAAEACSAEHGPGFGFDWIPWPRALVLEAEGDAARALEVLGGAWTSLEGLRGRLADARRLWSPDLVRLAVAQGDTELAERVATTMEASAQRRSTDSSRAIALRCRGLADSRPDDLVVAVSHYEAAGRTFDAARTSAEAGEALHRAGRDEEAIVCAERALTDFESIGALREGDRALALLRTLGVRKRRKGSRRTVAVGWDALSDTELRVVRLAGEGLTNRQIGERLFISHRTVESHLLNVYRKVGVNSRVQMTAEAIRRGLVDVT